MKKTIVLVILIVIILAVSIFVAYNKYNQKVLYETTYYFAFGSRAVKIYENGKVFDDLEIEEPEHTQNYKYVIQLIYGVSQFDDNGNY